MGNRDEGDNSRIKEDARIQEQQSDIVQRRDKETGGHISAPENVIILFSAHNGNVKIHKEG